MNRLWFLISVIFCNTAWTGDLNLASSSTTNQIKNIRVVAPYWASFTHHDGTGLFFDIIKLVYETPDTKITTQIVPWARGVMYINNHHADLLLGDTRLESVLQSKYPLDLETIVAISKKKPKNTWLGPNSLKNKIVGFIRGYDFINKISFNVQVYNFSYPEQGWGMLNKDRIDYYIENHTDALIHLKENKINPDVYNFHPLWSEELVIQFQNTPRGQALAKIYNKKYPIIHADGRLESLYKKYQIPYVDPLKNNIEGIKYLN